MLFQYTDKIHHILFATFSLSRVKSDFIFNQRILLKNTHMCVHPQTRADTHTLSGGKYKKH